MRTIVNVSVDLDVAVELKRRAEQSDITFSRVVEQMLRVGLQMAGPAVKPAAVFNTKEAGIIRAMETLHERRVDAEPDRKGDTFFNVREIAACAGGFPSTIMPTLRKLEERFVLMCEMVPDIEAGKLGTPQDVECWAIIQNEFARGQRMKYAKERAAQSLAKRAPPT